MHADPLPIHGLQFRLDREDEYLDVGQRVPAVTTTGLGEAPGGRWWQIGAALGAGVWVLA
jgi:hypothetical protein